MTIDKRTCRNLGIIKVSQGCNELLPVITLMKKSCENTHMCKATEGYEIFWKC